MPEYIVNVNLYFKTEAASKAEAERQGITATNQYVRGDEDNQFSQDNPELPRPSFIIDSITVEGEDDTPTEVDTEK